MQFSHPPYLFIRIKQVGENEFFISIVMLQPMPVKKRLCYPRKSSLRVDPILEGLRRPGKQTGSHKSYVRL